MSAKTTLIPLVGAAVIRLFGLSWKIQVIDSFYLDRAREYSKNVIFASWHGRLLPVTYLLRNQDVHVLASEHEDGELLARAMRRLGYGNVRGSSTRGGVRAIRELVEKSKGGYDLGITVDGPRGPVYCVKPGPVEIAKLAGAAIVPFTSASNKRKVFSSWDSFELPYPFAKVRVRYGEPVIVPADADEALIEEKRVELETILREITKKSDEQYHS